MIIIMCITTLGVPCNFQITVFKIQNLTNEKKSSLPPNLVVLCFYTYLGRRIIYLLQNYKL